MTDNPSSTSNFGKWMALTAALLGWLFDGLEMGLFPLVAGPALKDLGVEIQDVPGWLGIITALFLIGAATGGVLFGWLGDRIGRVRAMMLSVLTYALVSGLGGFATEAWQIGALRFFAALGMGGEWSLGVALINEVWPDRSRAFLAGLIGAAANVGYFLIALVGLGLSTYVAEIKEFLLSMRVPDAWVSYLMGKPSDPGGTSGWRLLMMLAALPALLTFFIRLFVPESQRWEHEKKRGATSHWANRDLLAVLVGSVAACGIILLWALTLPLAVQILGTALGLVVVTTGYTYPVVLYLQRAALASPDNPQSWQPTLRLMLLAACLSGVALLGTWGTVQQAPTWADDLAGKMSPPLLSARSDTQIWSSVGAILGTIVAALVADILGRRITYSMLCVGSMIIIPSIFLASAPGDAWYLPIVFLGGAITASFYGWLPLYLPELFRTGIRATGQGFGFNFGRVIAAIGVLQLGNLKRLFEDTGQVFASLAGIYLVGLVLIWFAPETKGQPLPE
jgi:SHS family sialic acid transporter-like MFS transporter